MCLQRITNRKPKSKGVGWKVFKVRRGGSLAPEIWNQRGLIMSSTSKCWLTEKTFRPSYIDSELIHPYGEAPYPLGFHIWLTLEGAKDWLELSLSKPNLCIRKVRYRKAHTRGIQCSSPVIVAKEIFIEKGK